MNQIKVIKSGDKPESTEILAEAIIRIGEAFEKLQYNGLNDYAIKVLIQHETKVAMRDIKVVLESLRKLRGWYCRK